MLVYLTKHPEAFDPETIELLSTALDEAWERIQTSVAQFNGNAEDARNILARHIVNLAALGERNRQRLIDGAMARYRL